MNDSNWEWYSNHRDSQQSVGLDLLSLWTDDWENGEIVLDIGCGTGELTKMIAERDNVKSVIGVDISANAIEFASKNNSVDGKTQYLVGDAMLLPETLSHFEKAFTKVYCNEALHWMEDKQTVLRNACWCLKETGSFLFHIDRVKSPFYNVYHKSIDLPKWMKYLKDFQPKFCPFLRSLKDLQDMISRSGFKKYPRTIERYHYSFSADTKDKHIGFLRPLMTHLDLIPASLHEDFLEDCFQIFQRASTKTEDGVLHWSAEAFHVKVYK
ncbi:uncharacterized protein [Ptychodera flava]|uniref:uncharacterized protein n=1 Tax=Ptychodera flava TaxID=63121 RepID=UPI003969EF20